MILHNTFEIALINLGEDLGGVNVDALIFFHSELYNNKDQMEIAFQLLGDFHFMKNTEKVCLWRNVDKRISYNGMAFCSRS